jgi:hypothetical protein
MRAWEERGREGAAFASRFAGWRPGPLLALAKVAVVAFFTLSLLGGLLYVRLLHGPVSLKLLLGPIERGLSQELSDLGVHIEDVSLQLNEASGLQFELKNVRVTDERGATLAAAPSAAVGLSLRALVQGRIALESVDLISPRVLLFYSEDGTLSLKFSGTPEAAEAHRGRGPGTQTPEAPLAGGAEDSDSALARIDLVKMLSETSARARRGEHAGAFLREVGLRSATVIVDTGVRKTIWRVPELHLDLKHRRSRTSIAGRATVASLAGPWSVEFRTYEAENAKTIQLTLSVQGLIPRGLARTLPQLAGLESFDVPVSGEAQFALSTKGEIVSGTVAIDSGRGRLFLPWLPQAPLRIDAGRLEVSYSSEARRFEIAPSILVWGDSRVKISGHLVQTTQGPDGPAWAFELKSEEGWLGSEPRGMKPLAIDHWSARGLVAPEQGRIVLSQILLRAGGTEVSAKGEIADVGGATKARLEGQIGPMPASVFKTLWPAPIAPAVRDWVVRSIVSGNLQGGSFKLVSGGGSNHGYGAGGAWGDRLSLTLEGANLEVLLLQGWPALELPRALLRLEGPTLEVTAPEGSLIGSQGRRALIRGGMLAVDASEQPASAQITFRAQGPLSLAQEMLDAEPLKLIQATGLALSGAEGKVDAQLRLTMPISARIGAADVKVEGKARIVDGRVRQALGPYDVQSANVVIDASERGLDVRGDLVIRGVPVKASWQHVRGAPADQQPPLRLAANLTEAHRTQLGLDVNHLVQGEAAVELTAARVGANPPQVSVRADLSPATLTLESLAWRKPPGRAAVFHFDVVRGTSHPIELHNVRLQGEDIDVEGWMGIGPDNRPREFRFPRFSLALQTRLETHGKLRADNVWEVRAKGPTFDGRDLFRSLFFGVPGEASDPAAKTRPGLDLWAEIDTVIGYSDATLKNVRTHLQKRANKLVGLDARGILDSGEPFAAIVRSEAGQPRRLLAESRDAGQTFKLVGFYPNAYGGLMTLEVNLDGQGAAERVGTLWAKDFYVLGDPVVSQVMQTADDPRQGGGERGRRTVVREKFEFESLRAPFSVGHGQFVLHNAAINGPLVSATMRGKVDFAAQTLNVGGTFTPLSGLNRALAPVPLVGPLMTGPRGEGVFAMTFAIQGPMSNPQVLVNPLSILTPGITREIMQMTPENPRVVPRSDRPGARSKEGARRAPVAPTAASEPAADPVPPRPAPEVSSGWSAETSETRGEKKE